MLAAGDRRVIRRKRRRRPWLVFADRQGIPQCAQLAAKAAGAKRRLESVGQSIELRGKALTRGSVRRCTLSRARDADPLLGHMVRAMQRDMQTLKALQAKYAARGFSLVGVNLDKDSDVSRVEEYVRA